jgi:hypothetical protein
MRNGEECVVFQIVNISYKHSILKGDADLNYIEVKDIHLVIV